VTKTTAAFRLLCSKRRGDVDLAKWLGGGYSHSANDPDMS
jgi:endogenous inhibitor of DNA gyrase (YacG/DUF329 family)